MEEQYSRLAQYYDRLMSDIPYGKIAKRIDSLLKRSVIPVKDVLELGCGTGTVSHLLSKAGYEMIGVDASPDMLSIAREKCADLDIPPVLLHQDMCSLDLYGTVQGVVCTMDGVNYLDDKRTLKRAMRRIGLFMEKGGLFIFDVKHPRLFEEMDGTASVCEVEGAYCTWQYGYDKKSRLAVHQVDIFEKINEGYRRTTEEHVQRAFTNGEIMEALEYGGFCLTGIFRDYTASRGGEGGRLLMVAHKE